MHRNELLPEGAGPLFPENQPLTALREAMERQSVLTGRAVRCSAKGDLSVLLGGYHGVISREDAVHLDEAGHRALAAALYGEVTRIGRLRAARAR